MIKTHRTLIDEYPLLVLPSLAVAVGLNEAIFLQQLHYWLGANRDKPSHFHKGRVWVKNSIQEWIETNFPFWSDTTLRRTIGGLVKSGIVLKGDFNKDPYDHSLWYSINYEILASVFEMNEKTSDQIDMVKMTTSTSPEWTDQDLNRDYKTEIEDLPSSSADLRENTMSTMGGAHKKIENDEEAIYGMGEVPAGSVLSDRTPASAEPQDPPDVERFVRGLAMICQEEITIASLPKFQEAARWLVNEGYTPEELWRYFGQADGWWYTDSFGRKDNKRPYLKNVTGSIAQAREAKKIVFYDV